MMEHSKISNSKHQITNKSQIPILNDQNRFGILKLGTRPQGGESGGPILVIVICLFFVICDLEFLLLQYSKTADNLHQQSHSTPIRPFGPGLLRLDKWQNFTIDTVKQSP